MLERRRSPRLAYFTSARLENASGAWDGSVRDISAEGMFLETPRKFKAGERLNVAFHLRHSGQQVDMAAEIKRVTPEGVGLQIIW